MDWALLCCTEKFLPLRGAQVAGQRQRCTQAIDTCALLTCIALHGNLDAFYAVPWLPYSADDDHRNLLSHVYRLCLQGLVELEQLRLSLAERHFRVEKIPGDPTHTRIEPLDDAQRRDEVERMLGGAEFLASIERQ